MTRRKARRITVIGLATVMSVLPGGIFVLTINEYYFPENEFVDVGLPVVAGIGILGTALLLVGAVGLVVADRRIKLGADRVRTPQEWERWQQYKRAKRDYQRAVNRHFLKTWPFVQIAVTVACFQIEGAGLGLFLLSPLVSFFLTLFVFMGFGAPKKPPDPES